MNHTPMLIQQAAARDMAERARAAIARGETPARASARPLNLPARYADQLVSDDGPYALTHRIGSVGIVRVDGPMWYSPHSWSAWFGGGSIASLIRALDTFAGDPSIDRIVLDLHTPGGEANPLDDMVNAVRAAAAAKPVHARLYNTFSMGIAASAMATEVSISRTAQCGAVGSLIYMYDDSAMLADDGIRVVVGASPEGKGRYAPGVPVPDEVQAELQAVAERCADDFIAVVAEGRRLDPAIVRSWNAREFFGDEAKAAGLVDIVEDEAVFWERVLSMPAARPAGIATNTAKTNSRRGRVAPASRAGTAARARKKGPTMNGTRTEGGVRGMTAEELIEKMAADERYDDEMIDNVRAMLPEEDETENSTEEDDTTNTAEEETNNAGGEDKPASFKQLDSIVPRSLDGRDGLITKLQRTGASVNAAHAAVSNHVLEEMKKLQGTKANNDAAERETKHIPEGIDPVPANRGGGGGGGSAKAEWEAAIDAEMKVNGGKRPAAVAKIARTRPELNDRMIAEANTSRAKKSG